MNCVHHLLLLLGVRIANITKPVRKLTKLSKHKKHHQKISAKLACILVPVGIKCPKSFRREIQLGRNIDTPWVNIFEAIWLYKKQLDTLRAFF